MIIFMKATLSRLETLISKIPPFKSLLIKGDVVRNLLQQSNSLHQKYKETLATLSVELTLLEMVQKEILIKGESEHLITVRRNLESSRQQCEKKCNKIKKSLDELELKLNAAQVIYNKGSNNFGIFWAGFTVVFLLFILYYVHLARLILATLNPGLKELIDTIALKVDPTFYELVAQIILALTVALFIKRSHSKSTTKRDWWEYSKFAWGVTCAIAGTATCLYVVAGATPGVYTLSLVIFCLLVLLFSALKPLLYGNNKA